jgi:TRAP-type C4-dicarboxylate transport system permease small subunit
MDGVKKVGQFLRNCVELYIPICAFLIMFIVFVVQIAARYIFNSPLPWAYEITVMCYLWLVILGACFAYRDRSHVTFTLIYDKLGVKGKALCAFLGNVLMLIAFVAMFVPSVNFIMQMKIQVTSVFKIGLNIVYFPFIPFMIIMICYFLYDIYVEIMAFTGNQKYIDLMLNATKSETEEAIEMAKAQEAEGKEAGR